MSRNGFRYTYLCLTALAWTVFLVIMFRSAKDGSSSSFIDEKDPQKRENVDIKSIEKDKDFGEQRRKDKLANQILQEDIQKENEEIIKIGEKEIKGKNNAEPIDLNGEQKSVGEDNRINQVEKIDENIKHVDEKEKDKRRRILNEKEKERKSKMGKRLKDQLKDHKNEAIDQIISDIN
mgnify:CR=1 FL=1